MYIIRDIISSIPFPHLSSIGGDLLYPKNKLIEELITAKC
nr:MAG TPA: hypothetical protein [Caudoviricetes sp.]